jgi:hypothetical protein
MVGLVRFELSPVKWAVVALSLAIHCRLLNPRRAASLDLLTILRGLLFGWHQ